MVKLSQSSIRIFTHSKYSQEKEFFIQRDQIQYYYKHTLSLGEWIEYYKSHQFTQQDVEILELLRNLIAKAGTKKAITLHRFVLSNETLEFYDDNNSIVWYDKIKDCIENYSNLDKSLESLANKFDRETN